MGILWCTKAPRADIYSQFVSALRTTAGASSADRVGRDPCVPPRSTHCSRRGTRVPPYRVRRSHGADRVVRPYAPCHCEPVRAAKQVPLGYRLARQSVFPQRKGRIPTPVTRSLARNDSAAALSPPSQREALVVRPLDKPVGMGIIVDVRGRCDKRSAPLRENFNEPYGSQKPSPCRVAVFVFQLHNTDRNGIPPDVESKYPVHVCHPLSGL